ncbi:MAG: hypothetical protein ABEJ40_08245 [Haloarculaceae archaeon]
MAARLTELPTPLNEPGTVIQRVGSTVASPLTGAAFWAAVVLPFLHVPLLLLTGLSSSGTATAFTVLLALNVLALLLGHPHYRE